MAAEKIVLENAERTRSAMAEQMRWRYVGLSEIHRRMLKEPTPKDVNLLDRIVGGSFLYGPPGTGKTFNAVHALSRAMKERMSASGRITITAELILDLRRGARDGRDAAILDDLSSVDFLIIDDLGTERITDYAAESLYLLVDRWHRNCKSGLIVTSNLNPSDLASKIGDKIVSRLMEICPPIRMDGQDRRIK